MQLTIRRGDLEQAVTVTAVARSGADSGDAAYLGIRYVPVPAGMQIPELRLERFDSGGGSDGGGNEAERDDRTERFRIRPRIRMVEPFPVL